MKEYNIHWNRTKISRSNRCCFVFPSFCFPGLILFLWSQILLHLWLLFFVFRVADLARRFKRCWKADFIQPKSDIKQRNRFSYLSTLKMSSTYLIFALRQFSSPVFLGEAHSLKYAQFLRLHPRNLIWQIWNYFSTLENRSELSPADNSGVRAYIVMYVCL